MAANSGAVDRFLRCVSVCIRPRQRTHGDDRLLRFKNTALVRVLKEKRREAEEANRSKSRFLAAASHDLRQPMNALSINSYLLRASAPNSKTLELATEVEKSVRGLDELFAGLLDISKMEAGTVQAQLRVCSTRPLFEHVVRDHSPVATAKGLGLNVESSDALVRTDPLLLGRVIQNLVSNAIRYTPEGTVRVHASASENWLVIDVSDTGIGIAAEEFERIFEDFYQVGNSERDRERGTGLGSAIVRRYVELLGCQIDLRSEPDQGSHFIVRVPLATEAAAAQTPEAVESERGAVDLTGMAILVLDDDISVRRSMSAMLTEWGCVPLPCASQNEAIESVERHSAPVDFIIAA